MLANVEVSAKQRAWNVERVLSDVPLPDMWSTNPKRPNSTRSAVASSTLAETPASDATSSSASA
eukprot:5106011-Amphidinium_carterae.1